MHDLALALHMPVAELQERMSMHEFARWGAFFEEQERERQRERNRAAGIVDFTDPKASQQLVQMVGGGGKPRPRR